MFQNLMSQTIPCEINLPALAISDQGAPLVAKQSREKDGSDKTIMLVDEEVDLREALAEQFLITGEFELIKQGPRVKLF